MISFIKLTVILTISFYLKEANCNYAKIKTSKRVRTTFRQCKFGFSGENCDVECGRSLPIDEAKIIGGNEAVPHSWPSMVHLKIFYTYRDGSSTSFVCGGSLIDERTILTASHCVKKIKYKQQGSRSIRGELYLVRAYFGLHSVADLNSGIMVEINKTQIITHEEFDSQNLNNDIALLKLKRRLALNRKVQLACLPWSDLEIPSMTNSVAIGWGYTTNTGSLSKVLKEVNLTIYDSNDCSNTAENLVKYWPTLICAGDLDGLKSKCKGDSGGPLFVSYTRNGISKNILVGLTSFSDLAGCAIKNKPGFFTKVSYYIDWINRKA